MKLELVSIPTPTAPLDGLYYEPVGDVVGAVLLMHGNTMNFYVGAPRFLPPHLTRMGLACLAFNRRGHDVLSTRSSRRLEGGAFQKVAEAREDNRLAAAFLRERGHDAPFVIGHSNGGMLAARHVADTPETPGLVLLSAHVGGKTLVPLAAKTGLLAGDRYDELHAQAEQLVRAGEGDSLMLMPGWWHAISAASFLDLIEEMPDLLESAEEIACPTLFVRGDQEPRDMYPGEAFAERSPGPCDVVVLEGCDHFYNGVEDTVARTVSDWLAGVLSVVQSS